MPRIFLLAPLLLATAQGCALPWQRAPLAVEAEPAVKTTNSDVTSSDEQVDQQALLKVVAELDEIGTLDPELKQKIIEDLQNTKPSLWAATVQVYRSALAYRKQVEERRDSSQQTQLAGYQSTSTAAASPARLARTASEGSSSKGPIGLPEVDGLDRGAKTDFQETETLVQKSVKPLETRQKEPAERFASSKTDLRPVEPGNWQSHLSRAIEQLEAEAKDSPESDEKVSREVALRMLYLVASRREEAVRPIEGTAPVEQDYWTKQLYTLATFVDSDGIPDPRRRAAEAKRHLNEANAKLGELSSLLVRELVFCTEISSFGVYKAFETREFLPGQEVLLYAEVENFKSIQTESGYKTSLKSRYKILDRRGTLVFEDDFDTTEDICRNRRRDFFMRYRIWIPKRIFDGTYTLKLTIEDEAKREIGQASIEFQIKE